MGKSTEILSGVLVTSITTNIADPVCAAYVGGVIQPLFVAAAEEFNTRFLSIREEDRVHKVMNDAICKIQSRLEKGDIPRNDDFLNDSKVEPTEAKAILEGVLLKAKDEYEEKKLVYYSNLIAQMVFDSSWNYQRINAMLRMFDQLSYRQLQLMALAQRKGEINTPQWCVKFKRTPISFSYYDLYCEVVQLSNLSIFHQPGGSLMMGIGDKQALSPIGKAMAELMELPTIPQEELKELDEMIILLNDKILHM